MKRNILKELLADAYDAWSEDRLTDEAYKSFAELIRVKADALVEDASITDTEWAEIEEEHAANLLLVDDIAEL